MRDAIRYSSLKRTKAVIEHKSVYEKSKSYKGHKLLAKAFDWAFDQMIKKGFLQPYLEENIIDTYDHTPTKSKLVSDRVLETIHAHERDFGRVSPETHVILMGEDDFFETVNEKRMNNPFFGQQFVRMQTDLRFNTSPYKWGAAGMPIYVVPSIMGLAIVPKNIIEKHV